MGGGGVGGSWAWSNFFNFMQFSAKILANNRFLLQNQGLAPPCHLGNPGSATGQVKEKCHRIAVSGWSRISWWWERGDASPEGNTQTLYCAKCFNKLHEIENNLVWIHKFATTFHTRAKPLGLFSFIFMHFSGRTRGRPTAHPQLTPPPHVLGVTAFTSLKSLKRNSL